MTRPRSKQRPGPPDVVLPDPRCPLCHRPMVLGPSVDEHHWVPKSRGGAIKQQMHRVCHQKLHSLWTERELETVYNTPEKARAAPEIADFLRWIARKPAEFNARHVRSSIKGRR